MSECDPRKIKDECDKLLTKLTKGKKDPDYYYQAMMAISLEYYVEYEFKNEDFDSVHFYLGIKKEISNYIDSRIAKNKMRAMERQFEKFITKEKNPEEESQPTVN